MLAFLVNGPAVTVMVRGYYLKCFVKGLLTISLEPTSVPVELPSGQSLKTVLYLHWEDPRC